MSAIPHIGATVRQRIAMRPLQQVNETQPEPAQFCAVVDEPTRFERFREWLRSFEPADDAFFLTAIFIIAAGVFCLHVGGLL